LRARRADQRVRRGLLGWLLLLAELERQRLIFLASRPCRYEMRREHRLRLSLLLQKVS
jgi:hypothetical protein